MRAAERIVNSSLTFMAKALAKAQVMRICGLLAADKARLRSHELQMLLVADAFWVRLAAGVTCRSGPEVLPAAEGKLGLPPQVGALPARAAQPRAAPRWTQARRGVGLHLWLPATRGRRSLPGCRHSAPGRN